MKMIIVERPEANLQANRAQTEALGPNMVCVPADAEERE